MKNKREVTTDTTEKLWEYYEQLYANKLDNLEEMDNLLETYSLSRLGQEETDNLHRLIPRSEKESVIKELPANKSPELDGFTGEFTKHTKKKLYLFFSNYSKWLKRRNSAKLIVWGHHHPDTKSRQRHYKKRKLQANIFDEYGCKNPQQNISKPNPTVHKKDHTSWSSWIHSTVTSMAQYMQKKSMW